jgi:hypothetical protein
VTKALLGRWDLYGVGRVYNEGTQMAFSKTHLVLLSGCVKSIPPRRTFLAQLKAVSLPLCSNLKKYVPAGLALAGLVLICGPMQAKAPRMRTKSSHVKIHAMPFSAATVLAPGTVAADDTEVPDDGQKYSLKLYSMHTNENINVVYRIGDIYLPDALDKLNHFLRDHYTDDVNH